MSRYNFLSPSKYAKYFAPPRPDSPQIINPPRYPEISLDPSDIYVYITKGDRYDLLAFSYYGDSSLWWIIATANPSQSPDSLIPDIGTQIRIPGPQRKALIIYQYEIFNTVR